jgi:hypothetical protein
MSKYKDVPIERREDHRWQDMNDYLDHRISRDELRRREQGAEHSRSGSVKESPGKNSPKGQLVFL